MELPRRVVSYFSKAKAPDLKAVRWYNSPPLTWNDLRGEVVLIDFFTYSCINCVRTFPHLRYLWSELKDEGLMIIGVQTPEFTFEKDFRNIEDAIRRHRLAWPIAVDNDYEIWNAFGNQYWPGQFFVDKDGYVRHYRAGEDGEAEIEEWISLLLRQASHSVTFGSGPHEDVYTGFEPITPETYCGFLRNTGMGNPAECDKEGRCRYADKDGEHQPGVIYLDGEWKQTEEYLEHEGEASGRILLPYQAAEVNVVMTAAPGIKVEVTIDGGPLPERMAGEDLAFEERRSVVEVSREDMYRLVRTKASERHELGLVAQAPGLRVFVYTFGSADQSRKYLAESKDLR